LLRRISRVWQQDGAGAGPERWLGKDQSHAAFSGSHAQQKVQKRARLSAGNHDAVNAIELLGLAHQRDFGANCSNGRVLCGFIVTLNAKTPIFI